VGYTRLTEERGDAAAATLAEALAVLVQGGDYFGRTVNLAPRIAVHASASRVLVSERVAKRAPPLGVTFVEVGLVQLEGIAQPVRLLEARRRNLRRFRFVSTKPAHPSRPGRASRDRRPRTNY
jgi:hypothetical protein